MSGPFPDLPHGAHKPFPEPLAEPALDKPDFPDSEGGRTKEAERPGPFPFDAHMSSWRWYFSSAWWFLLAGGAPPNFFWLGRLDSHRGLHAVQDLL